MKQHLYLFLAFFRVGIFGYGGGPASIPLVHKEVVQKYQWLDDRDFNDLLALANTLPGPIATKMAGYIGQRVAGFFGMLNAVLATMVPSIVAMIVLLTSLAAIKDQPWVRGMVEGVLPVVGVMLGVLTWQFFRKAQEGLGWVKSLLLVAGSLAAIQLLPSPAILIAVLLLAALLKPSGEKKKTETPVDQEGSG
ncbi:MAG TPA: chromate transporter [Bacillales bacterium]|nr:chromate transporter [Bacillales bacterium]